MESSEGRKFVVHYKPGEVYERQVKVLTAYRQRYGDESYYAMVRELILSDLWFFLRYVLDYKFLDDHFHGHVVLKHYYNSIFGNGGKPCDLLTLIPRGHCKTIIVSAFVVQELLNDPNMAIAIVSGTEKLARFMAKLIADTLLYNPILQRCFSDVLPNAKNLTTKWGLQGYFLPNRKPRVDPSLAFGSATANVTGTHPDLLIFDDLVYSNAPRDLEIARNCFIEAMGLLPSHGRILINGTRWSDGDLYGKILDGEFKGNLGEYQVLLRGCYKMGVRNKPVPIYPKKFRNGMTTETGFSMEDLARKKHNDSGFFNCQYLNDPAPESDAEMRREDVCVYNSPEELPPYLRANCVGVETVGASVTFPNVLRKELEDFGINIYVQEIKPSRTTGGGKVNSNKRERILAACAPIVGSKKLWIKKWMTEGRGCLLEQIIRLKALKHDDIIDALHMIISYMSVGLIPDPRSPANLYVCTDLAFTNSSESDFTCFMAVAVDSKANYWVVDYRVFKETNPVNIARELIKFFQKVNASGIDPMYNKVKRASLGRSYNR